MTSNRAGKRRATARDLHYFATLRLWVLYPFLPLMRRVDDSAERQCGLLRSLLGPFLDPSGASRTAFWSALGAT